MGGSAGVIVGGLGGGGDVGLAFILGEALGGEYSVVSFHPCRADSAKFAPYRVRGSAALVRPLMYHERNLDYSLALSKPELEVYAVCARSDWSEVVEAVKLAVELTGARCWLAADIGGDGIVTGMESRLGSFRVDTRARAALTEAAGELGFKFVLAIGGLGLEGGNVAEWKLDMNELTADLLWYKAQGALLGVYTPPRELARLASKLLMAWLPDGRVLQFTSVMLPLYTAALKDKREAYVERGYSTGLHRLSWWHKHVFLLDGPASCKASPLCSEIIRNRGSMKHAERKVFEAARDRDRKRYASLLRRVRHRGFEELLAEIVSQHSIQKLSSVCPGSD